MSARLASKSAELGDVPEDWQVLPIGTISADIKTRNNSKRKLTVFAITKYHGLVPSLQYFKKRIFSEDLTNYKLVKKNQFVYSPIHLNEGAIGLLESENEGLVSPLHIVFELKPEASPRFFK